MTGASWVPSGILTGPAVDVALPYGLVGLFRDRRSAAPDAVAVQDPDRSLSYAELDRLSDLLADRLTELTGGRRLGVVLRVPRGVDFGVAVLGVLKAGCWYLPLGPGEPASRLASMLADAEPALVVCEDSAHVGPLAALPRLPVPRRCPDAPPRPLPEVPPDAPVYVRFTSGSTGTPKGVVLSHAALANRIWWMLRRLPPEPGDRVLQKTPTAFDVSEWEFYWPVLGGARCFFAPEGAEQDPARVLRLVEEHGITACHFVPSMLQRFLPEVAEGRCPTLRAVFCSGEALPAATVARCQQTLGVEVHNLYGPTEAAIEVTHWVAPPGFPPTGVVPLGDPLDNVGLQVLDADLDPVPPGGTGELWISGVQLADGYIGRPDLTAEAFRTVRGIRCYRTGDLVRSAEAGLEYRGRIDDQAKVRGVRVEPAEVERVLAEHPAVDRAVVVAAEIEDSRGFELLAAVTPTGDDPPSADVLREHLRDRLPPAFVPSGVRWLSDLPGNRTGKVDRVELRRQLVSWWRAQVDPDTGTATPAASAADPVARAWWQAVGQSGPGTDRDTGFLSSGGHSLVAARLVADLVDLAGVQVPLALLLQDNVSLAQLEAFLATASRTGPAAAPTGAGLDRVPLAPGQRGLWLLSQVQPDAAAYNVTVVLTLAGALDVAVLTAAFEDVVARRDVMRAWVEVVDGIPRLRFASEVPGRLEFGPVLDHLDYATLAGQVRAIGQVPLTTDRPGMWRAVLIGSRTADTAVLVLSLHHLISDQRTIDLVVADLASRYRARLAGSTDPVAPAPAYADHCLRMAAAADGPRWREDLAFWRRELTGAERPDLPFPVERPGAGRLGGDRREEVLGVRRSGLLRDYLRSHNATPAATLVACVAVVLARWTGRRTVWLGLPADRRLTRTDQETAGFMLRTLPIGLNVGAADTFADLVGQFRGRYADALDHSLPGFDDIVADQELATGPARDPLFSSWVNDLSQNPDPPSFPGLDARFPAVPGSSALFDLNFYLRRAGDGYRLELLSRADRVPSEVADEVLRQCVAVLDQVLAEPDGRLDRPPPPTRADPARRPVPDRSVRPVRDLVREVLEHGRRDPAQVAVEADRRVVTYAELAEQVAGTARRLADLGCRPGEPVLIRASRTAAYPVALLAAWWSGCVPVLVDATLPTARRAAQEGLCRPAAILTADHAVPSVVPAAEAAEALPGVSHVLFTSGTSGQAAAVALPDAVLPAALDWYRATFRPGPEDRVALLSGLGHDPVLRDMLVPLLAGGRLLVPPEGATDPVTMVTYLARSEVTVLHATPPLLDLMLAGAGPEDWLPRLRLIVSGGAPLRWNTVRRLRRLTAAVVANGYGATETPQIVACHQLDRDAADDWASWSPDAAAVPIGQPVPETEIWIERTDGRRAGIGELGEIVVRGRQVMSGYLAGSRPVEVGGDGRTHRTGDQGRLDPAGRLHVAGRIDRQVSIDGFRVALEEVEAAALRHGAVVAAAAGLKSTSLGPALVLDVVTAPTGAPTSRQLRSFLGSLLPAYAVPPEVRLVDRLGTDANHKVAGPGAARVRRDRPDPAPDVDTRLAALVHEVTGAEVGPDHNLFDAGLTSVGLVALHGLLTRTYGLSLPVTEMFAHPTMRALSQLIGGDPAVERIDDGPGDPPDRGDEPDLDPLWDARRRARAGARQHGRPAR